jgi:hypothetical protein
MGKLEETPQRRLERQIGLMDDDILPIFTFLGGKKFPYLDSSMSSIGVQSLF